MDLALISLESAAVADVTSRTTSKCPITACPKLSSLLVCLYFLTCARHHLPGWGSKCITSSHRREHAKAATLARVSLPCPTRTHLAGAVSCWGGGRDGDWGGWRSGRRGRRQGRDRRGHRCGNGLGGVQTIRRITRQVRQHRLQCLLSPPSDGMCLCQTVCVRRCVPHHLELQVSTHPFLWSTVIHSGDIAR